MIRPEITEETFNKVKTYSGKINGSFEEALKILLTVYDKAIYPNVVLFPESFLDYRDSLPNFRHNKKRNEVIGSYRK